MPTVIPKKVTELSPEEFAARSSGVLTPKRYEEMSPAERVAQIPGIEPLPGQDPTLRAPRYVEHRRPLFGLLENNEFGRNVGNAYNAIPELGLPINAIVGAVEGLRSIPAAIRAGQVAREAGFTAAGAAPASAALANARDEPTIRRKP